jgi:hypothetical protein
MEGVSAMGFDEIVRRLERVIEAPDSELRAASSMVTGELLGLGETILELWLAAHGKTPTRGVVEGFRLLALHRQAARGDPSFNACRETCRELVYHHNLTWLAPADADAARRLRLGAMVAQHLALFVGGKLETAGLGEFCCASRPLRQRGVPHSIAGTA